MNQDIEVMDSQKLKESIKDLDHNYLISEDGNVSFSNWCGHKIEGYWYDETRRVLNAIAPFIKGWVEFQYEEGYLFRIVFEDGKVYFQRQPEVDWSRCPKGIILDRED